MSILFQCALPALGICRTFPRELVFAPQDFFGLGIQHLFTLQEIFPLKDLIAHSHLRSITGQLYTTSLEFLHLELGSFLPLSSFTFEDTEHLVTQSLVKSSWQFLNKRKLSLQTDLNLPPQRENDSVLMELAFNYTKNWLATRAINRCRLYLYAFFVSDIACASGVQLLDEAWNGDPNLNSHRANSWPNQGKPTLNDWDTWRTFLKACVLGRGRYLKNPLGHWLVKDHSWPWHYDPIS
jgi:hypothetical protein